MSEPGLTELFTVPCQAEVTAQFGLRIVFTTDEASISHAQRVLIILTEGVLDHAGPTLLEVKLPHARMKSALTCAGGGVEDGQS